MNVADLANLNSSFRNLISNQLRHVVPLKNLKSDGEVFSNEAEILFDDSTNVDTTLLRDLGHEIQAQLMQQFPRERLEKEHKDTRLQKREESELDYQKLVERIAEENKIWSRKKNKPINIDLEGLGKYKLVDANDVTCSEYSNKPVAVSFTFKRASNKKDAPEEIYINFRLKREKEKTNEEKFISRVVESFPSFISLRNSDSFVSYKYNSESSPAKMIFKLPEMGANRALIDESNARLYLERPYMQRKNIGRVPLIKDLHKVK